MHDLRHSVASQAVLEGIPLPVVARILGHRQVSMTLRYVHVAEKEVEAAAATLRLRMATAMYPSIPIVTRSFPSSRIFGVNVTLRDGRPLHVNTDDDVASTEEFDMPIPGHQSQAWRFQKVEEHGTSLAYAAVSWDPGDPTDYLMAGYWAYYPDQHPPDLDPLATVEISILDGPEFDKDNPPDMPVSGTASYAGLAGGIYAYLPGATIRQRHFTFDGWEGVATLAADFGEGTVSGCIGCVGDLAVRTAIAPASRGDVQHDISDYEIHLFPQPFWDGDFAGGLAVTAHPDREIVRSIGRLEGTFSNKPDAAGNPRLVSGFASSRFNESDESIGYFFGSYVGLSEALRE